MKSLNNLLTFLYENWVSILVCIGLLVGIARKTITFFRHSKEERIEIAKAQVKEAILKMIEKAEADFSEWNKAGSIKRSQVIHEIFKEYPVLSYVADQEELIKWIDEQIDNSLEELRDIIGKNNKDQIFADDTALIGE